MPHVVAGVPGCFYPSPYAQEGVNLVSWDVPGAHNTMDTLETGDIKDLLNPLLSCQQQPGNSVMFKFTPIPPPPPPYDPSPCTVRGLRVFEAGGKYPMLTYTACTTGVCPG